MWKIVANYRNFLHTYAIVIVQYTTYQVQEHVARRQDKGVLRARTKAV